MPNDVSLLRSVLNRSNIKQSDPALYQALFRVIDYLAEIPSSAIIAPGANGEFIYNKDGNIEATPNFRIEPQHGHLIAKTAIFSGVGLGVGDWNTRNAFLFVKTGATLTGLRVININMSDANANLDMRWLDYTPLWQGTGVAPVVGNGSLTGIYSRIGRVVFFKVRLIMGSTTTFGSGNYRFSFPVTETATGDTVTSVISQGMFFDASTGLRYVINGYRVSSGLFEPTYNVAGGSHQAPFTATAPVTLAAGDQLQMMGYFQSVA